MAENHDPLVTEDETPEAAEVTGGAGAIEDEIVRRLTLIQVEDMRAGIYLQVGNAPTFERGKDGSEPIRVLKINGKLRH